MKSVVFLVFVLMVSATAFAAETSSSTQISKKTVADSGGLLSSSSNYAARSAIGQAISGTVTSSTNSLCNGILCKGPVTVSVYSGNNTNVEVLSDINVSVRFFDMDNNTYPAGINGTIWFEQSDGLFAGYVCTSDSAGVCNVAVQTTCDIAGSNRRFIGGIRNDPRYPDVNMTSYGYYTVDATAGCGSTASTVTFSMEIDSSSGVLDGSTGTSSSKRYGCISNPSLSGNPSIGIVSSGSTFRQSNITTSGDAKRIDITEYLSGNKFVVPVTTSGCDVVSTNVPVLTSTESFTSFVETTVNPLQLFVKYSDIDLDINNNVSARGVFTLSISKNSQGRIVVTKG